MPDPVWVRIHILIFGNGILFHYLVHEDQILMQLIQQILRQSNLYDLNETHFRFSENRKIYVNKILIL